MEIFTKKTTLLWVLITLTTLNLVLMTMFWIYKPERPFSYREKSPNEFRPADSARKNKEWQWQKEIGLDSAQHKKLQLLRKDYKKIAGELMTQMGQKQREIFEELQKETPDTVRLNAMAEETGRLHAGMRRESIKHILEIKSITTPDQQKRIMKFMQKHMPGDARQGGPPKFRREFGRDKSEIQKDSNQNINQSM